MKKSYLLIAFTLIGLIGKATNYFVDGVNGNNANSGITAAQAFKNIITAANLTYAGDTVFIMDGSYAAFTISRPGDATAQIVYTNYPGASPKIISNSTTYNVITVSAGANYITINGLEIIGYGVNLSLAADTAAAQAAIVCPAGATSTTNVTFVPKYNGSGINVGNSTTVVTHHVVISNNKVHDCAAAGMGFGYCDYITVDGNTVYNNSWYTPYGTSGISFGNSVNYDDNTTTYRTIIKNNICYGNRLYVLWRGSCTISDGNGIIVDVPQTSYTGKSLVYNNICYNNGGSGIHTINTKHIDFINNTAYMNSASPTNGGSAIYAYGSDDVKFYNNILVSRPGKTVNRCPNSTNVIYDYNIYYGGSTIDFVGAHSLIQDPKFVNSSNDPALADFHLLPGSFAVNNGDNTNTTPLDVEGKSRPLGSVVDMGAYESAYTGNLNSCSGTLQTKVLGSGGGTGEPGAIFYGPYDSKAGTSNQKGRRAFIYPQTLLTASGVPATATLTSLQFRRALQVNSTQVVPANSIVKIYLRNEASDNFGAAAFDWNTILPASASPAVLVYAGEASVLIGNAGGWKPVPFQVPFNYTGANLGVYVEYLQKGFVTSGTDVTWIYDNGGSQPLYNTATYPNQLYGSKATGTTGTIADALTTNSERRPILTVGYCVNSVLPVSFQQFNGVLRNSGVYLSWSVSTEINNAGFEVQRSVDGLNFHPIGFVNSKAANGNSSTLNHYDYTDIAPLAGTGFYRLIQKDRDGKQTFSTVISVINPARRLSLVSIYPNPVHNKVNVLVNVSGSGRMTTIILQDLSGRVISRFPKQLGIGYSNIEIDVSKQPASSYLLIIELPSGERVTHKFIKM
ncbi:MAG: hypothetical protein H7Z13_05630 [Ferruginibacter sp.]|nr:hypothetical protein [Ferruginibacter sp.]